MVMEGCFGRVWWLNKQRESQGECWWWRCGVTVGGGGVRRWPEVGERVATAKRKEETIMNRYSIKGFMFKKTRVI